MTNERSHLELRNTYIPIGDPLTEPHRMTSMNLVARTCRRRRWTTSAVAQEQICCRTPVPAASTTSKFRAYRSTKPRPASVETEDKETGDSTTEQRTARPVARRFGRRTGGPAATRRGTGRLRLRVTPPAPRFPSAAGISTITLVAVAPMSQAAAAGLLIQSHWAPARLHAGSHGWSRNSLRISRFTTS